MNTVDSVLNRNLRAEAEKRGYIVVAPAAPDGQLFFEEGARIFPEFLKMILADYKIQDNKFHIAGPSNGGIAAFHVAAANPQALDVAGLDPAVVKREKDVLADKYRQQGKPENVIEKIVESGLKTYYKEVCLLEQAFIHDSAKSVAQAVKEAEGKVGAPIKVTGFVRYALGEGIEKQESDFAAEVAAAGGQK